MFRLRTLLLNISEKKTTTRIEDHNFLLVEGVVLIIEMVVERGIRIALFPTFRCR